MKNEIITRSIEIKEQIAQKHLSYLYKRAVSGLPLGEFPGDLNPVKEEYESFQIKAKEWESKQVVASVVGILCHTNCDMDEAIHDALKISAKVRKRFGLEPLHNPK